MRYITFTQYLNSAAATQENYVRNVKHSLLVVGNVRKNSKITLPLNARRYVHITQWYESTAPCTRMCAQYAINTSFFLLLLILLSAHF